MNSPAVASVEPTRLGVTNLDDVRDLYFLAPTGNRSVRHSVNEAFGYTGTSTPFRVPDTDLSMFVAGLVEHVDREYPKDLEDFKVELGDLRFRAHREPTEEGVLVNLRRIPKVTPLLSDLVMPRWWRELLLNRELMRGGLIVFAAEMGNGKSTTIAATVKERLTSFSGFALTIEDPIELPLNGFHGTGRCVQREIDPKLPKTRAYRERLNGALRSFPSMSEGGGILVIGEVRDPETAAELVRISVNGTLVITTIHASNPKTAISRLVSLAAQELGDEPARDHVASAIRMVFYQRLRRFGVEKGWRSARIEGDVLVNKGDSHAVSNNIRDGKYNQLEHTLAAQKTQLGLEHMRSFTDLWQKL